MSQDLAMPSTHAHGRFSNAQPQQGEGFWGGVKAAWHFFTGKSPQSVPDAPIHIQQLTAEDIQSAPDQSLWRLGHSSILLKLAGKFWLIDPVFSERASPFRFIGPKRFHPVPIALDDLPDIEAVILSHDHYDHLDRDTVIAIQHKVGVFLSPLGVGDRLIDWGIPQQKIRQFDWWEETQIGAVTLAATPAQHFSGRGLNDRNQTLWASWVILTPESRVFFSGDSGYFEGFKAIGDKYGPFDVTLLENGAYNEAWADIHMQPEGTAQAHIDLRGRHLVPIHNGTFDLALHAWTEPLERITQLARQRGLALSTPLIGERLDILRPMRGEAWWVAG